MTEPNAGPRLNAALWPVGFGLTVLAGALLAVPALARLSSTGWIATGVISALCGLAGALCLYRAIGTAEPNLKGLVRLIGLSAVAFPVLAAWTALDLQRHESGDRGSVRLWLPLWLVYNHLGYLPAVLTLPVLEALCMGLFSWKVRPPAP